MDALRPRDPARIGAYELLARLGAGGMGEVFLGRSPGGRLVAVKVIRDEISEHPEALARFRREVATVETVRSAYTAQLIEASLGTSPYWLATEYVAGPTLRGAVGEHGPFPPDSALRLLAALAEGLAAVHVHGVTHRDLKPQNVILSPQGPQLIDFGIARGLGQTALTKDGTAPGTPGYAAPEVLLRNETGPAADVFALGATLAYTATGRPPFGTGEEAAVSFRTVYEDIDVAGVRPDLAALIRACVDKDPARRPDPAAVIAGCAVDSPLAADPHYRRVAHATEPVPGSVPAVEDAPPETVLLPEAGPTAPPDRDDRQRSPGRGPWGRFWLAVCAVAVAVPLTVWLLPEGDQRQAAGAGGGGSGAPASAGPSASGRPAGATPAGRPPDHIVNDRDSKDRWVLSEDPVEASQGGGSCERDLPDAFPPSGLMSSVSHTTGSDTASLLVHTKGAGKGKRPAPYYVSIGVRPPHETDPATGRPLKSVGKGIGFTSRPVDLYAHWNSGGSVRLSYPEDFRAHFGDRAVEAIPVGDDRGDWTVVIYHVEGAPTKYTSVSCNGFHA
ncbi:serine/threonine-protein kinase [Streptomyces sp. ITFR-16]|uniref:serine/threonine-protein kinase n=1 Tax=Streptomyces sp. ITFR-16 TaxID=3075198 RepID=UPI00288BD970|nr:serine/threonine-protein kinase [Streptomyces sp. ITFR-16]WNI26369.1 serine/threonine-protein kinase [Streptomyces sp. ITFR-16]